MAFSIIVISFIFCLWLLNRWRIRNYVNLGNKIPSNKLHNMVGFGPIVKAKDFFKLIADHGEKYGDNSMLWIGPLSFYLTKDPETVREIFTAKDCINRPGIVYSGITYIVGLGLLTNGEPDWSRHRKVLNGIFANKNLISFQKIFSIESDAMIKQISNMQKTQNEINLSRFFCDIIFNIAAKTMLKRDFDQSNWSLKEFTDAVEVSLDLCAEVCFNKLLHFEILRKLAELVWFKDYQAKITSFRKFITESIQIALSKDTSNPSYMSNINGGIDYALNGFLENKLKMSDVESEVQHLFFGAFETSASTLYFTVVLLAMFPEYQERVYEDVSSILSHSASYQENKEITKEDIEEMAYLDMFLNESMRTIPIVPQSFRYVANNDVKLSNGTTLPVGQLIGIDHFGMHRNKKFWGPDADRFNPDNFLPSNIASRHPFAFIPFSKGLRVCIGWRYALLFVKTTLAKMVMNFKFSTDLKYEDLRFRSHVALKIDPEPPIFVTKR